ncbi:methyltransferase domain-containing protein [Plectonema radiosum NIES-515]|jgi:2-polyprenyl-3-methyl-5-hydroxy-6-metoxy-1,4-benzoquinol methylase|uniref:Methyltransferase domain-containing protein n=1 Tax=Plectonema radiosum NIES-515 TaxID=2986073 RepID=A0ABT3AZU0_9CYAN|nr:methyltransferase domain-containing protein [Plectonema radiosum]MCV3214642.1 methyltransferase domain-containing protein [Plectonema radiosum NIES-515]
MTVFSPLNKLGYVTRLKNIQTTQIISDWKRVFQIDIAEELGEYEEICLYQCNQTKLQFFMPDNTVGSDKLYEQLEKYDWYYMPNKWEHDVALQDLQGCHKVLEVGCGRGAFVDRLCKEAKLEAQGIEINSSAVNYARQKGIPVSQINLNEFSHKMANQFDAVCAFQVLEHVSDPRLFLESLIQLVKPGGKLIISVPNSESFLQYCENNLLDQPPHHMTRWCQATFESLTSIFPLRLKQFRIEPLATYHVGWYISVQLSQVPKIRLLQSLAFRFGYQILQPVLKNSPLLRNFIPGHTLYVCLEKIS